MIDQDLLSAVQTVLLEPPNGGLGWPSELWTKDEMYGALAFQQQQLLKVTHAFVGVAEIAGVIGQSRYDLPDDWIATVFAAWDEPATASTARRVREILPADMHQADLGVPLWEVTDDTPIAYSDADTPTRTIQLIPAPAAAGTIQLLYVPLAPTPTGAGEVLQLPDPWCLPVLKYAVLESALEKIGRAYDPTRAGYCRWRRQLGEQVTRLLLGGLG